MSYTKQNFIKGQILKADHLNAMDDGIEANDLAIAALSEDKVNVHQGIEHVGKMLSVGTDGNVVPIAFDRTAQFNEAGLFVDVEPSKNSEVNVASHISGVDTAFSFSNTVALQQVSSENVYDVAGLLGGIGYSVEENGITCTIDENGVAHVSGTSTHTGWTNILNEATKTQGDWFIVFPPGTYNFPAVSGDYAAGEASISFNIASLDSKWTQIKKIFAGGVHTFDTPFWISHIQITIAAGATVDITVPLYVARGSKAPTNYLYNGILRKVVFSNRVADGVYNWTTGELTDSSGVVVEQHEPMTITALDGTNTFFSGVGEVEVSGEKDVNLQIQFPDVQKFDPTVWGLPILHLTGDTTGMSKDVAVDLAYAYGDRNGTASVKWQGSSSLNYPKKNYTIKFDSAFEAAEDWGEQKKYCFKANFIDHSHARNVGCAKLWGEIVKSRPLIGCVNGAVSYTGNNVSDRINVDNGILTTRITQYMTGASFFTGVTYPAGSHTITFEVYNPYSEEDNGGFAKVSCGKPGVENVDFVQVNINTIEAYNVWLQRSVTVDFPTDDSMIGFIIYSFDDADENVMPTKGYMFRNIKVDGVDYPITSDLKELQKLPNGGAIDGFPCVIMLNDEFHGLYTWNIPKDGWMYGMGNGTQEAIVCADATSEATRFLTPAVLAEGVDFELEHVTDEDNADWVLTSLNRLISACINSDGTDLDTTIAQYLDWESAIDYYAYCCAVGGADMAGKNYLLYTYDGMKWAFGAYDMDSTFGLWWDGSKFLRENNYPTIEWYSNYHRVMKLILTYKKEVFKARYAELRAGALSEGSVAECFSNFIAQIPAPVYTADAEKWPTIPSTAANNLSQILNWYRMRVTVLDKEIESL